jgi:hypothetical protein
VPPVPEPDEPVKPAEAYTLEKKGAWWSIYDRGGQKVGKATMDEAEARATLEALNAGE